MQFIKVLNMNEAILSCPAKELDKMKKSRIIFSPTFALPVLFFACSVLPVTAATTGTLTPSSTSCTIVSRSNSCNVNLSWSTTNPVSTSAVTLGYRSANTTVTNGNSGSQSFSGPYISNSRTFYFYNPNSAAEWLAVSAETLEYSDCTTVRWEGLGRHRKE
jgi:hypothetical protein